MIIHSHRGLGYGKEENTLAAFRAAFERGHGIEMDVRLRQDGEIVIKHDPLVRGEELPTCDALVELIQEFPSLPNDAVAIHLKAAEQTKEMIQALAGKIRDYGLYDIVFVFDVTRESADLFQKIDTQIRLAISLGAEPHALTIYTADQLDGFSDIPIIWWDEWGEAAGKLYSRGHAEELKERGYKVYVISPDVALQSGHPLARDQKYVPVWQDLMRWGVDGICTDVPMELVETLKTPPLSAGSLPCPTLRGLVG